MREKLSFAVSGVEFLDEINKAKFAKARIKAFASGDNAHHKIVSPDTLREKADTIYEVPIVWYYDSIREDATTHVNGEVPVGFVPKDNANLSLEEDENGRLVLSVDACIWRNYCGKFLEVFQRDGSKSVSVEMWVFSKQENENNQEEITDFAFTCITVLGEHIAPACDGSEMEITQFSKDKAEYEGKIEVPENIRKIAKDNLISNNNSPIALSFAKILNEQYIDIDKLETIKQYLKNHKKGLTSQTDIIMWCEDIKKDDKMVEFAKEDLGSGDYTITVDKSKKSVSTSSWGDVDKTALMHKVLQAKNYKSLIHSVYMVVESGWEDAPSQHLKYPVMQISGEKVVYNAGGLKSAQGYAETENQSSLASKIKGIRGKLGLTEEEKMSKPTKEKVKAFCDSIKFSKDDKELNKYSLISYSDDNIYCYDSEKDMCYAIPYSYAETDDKITADEEKKKKVKFSCVIIVDDDDDTEDPAEVDNGSGDDVFLALKSIFTSDANTLAEAQTKMDEIEAKNKKEFADLQDKKNDAEEKFAKAQEEVEKLQAEKTDRDNKERDEKVAFAISKLSDTNMPKERIEELRVEAVNFSLQELTAWENKVYAEAFTFGAADKKETLVRHSLPNWGIPKNEKESIWKRG